MAGNRPRLAIALSIAGVLAVAPRADAGPTIIRDDMLRELAITPTLGRGYSIATNTFQSICLVDIVKGKPSYDFKYEFRELETIGSALRSDAKFAEVDASGTSSFVDGEGVRWHRHHLQVTLIVDLYYSSLDEGKAKLSDAALGLLRDRDVPSFFEACGMYYTRSINRQSAFLSIFTYEDRQERRDPGFEMRLKRAIRAFGSAEAGAGVDKKLVEELSAKRTSVTTLAYGLGASDKTDPITYDIESFRASIRAAFTAMQSDDTGMVSSIEVVPWVEHNVFQSLVALRPADAPDPEDPSRKVRVSPYAQKRILLQNAEFISEVDRAARAKLNAFYKAKACRDAIEQNYRIGLDNGESTWVTKGDKSWGDRNFVSNRSLRDPITLSTLWDHVATQRLPLVFAEYDAFVYGGTAPPLPPEVASDPDAVRQKMQDAYATGQYPQDLFPGAEKCAGELMASGFLLLGHKNVASCRRLEATLTSVTGRMIDDYCPPREASGR